jgi:endonuclease YncB( thermonuclease family)
MLTLPPKPGVAWDAAAPWRLKPLACLICLAAALGLGVHAVRQADLSATGATHGGAERVIVGKAWVVDGDTIHVAGLRIRLLGIDAPESAQTCIDGVGKAWLCGRAATHELVKHLAGRRLRCQSVGHDRYRRVLAVCALPDGSDLNAWLVREGWALAYGYYRAEEAEAKAAKRGIWASTFIPPWEWRRQHRRLFGAFSGKVAIGFPPENATTQKD